MNSEKYAIYLRKSRKDIDAENRGEGETLARHERRLFELADTMGITIDKVYREIVSGDSVATRPVMQELLVDVENEQWAGVLVMEVERLARGDTIDQGIVAQAFKYSNTKIITPSKTYDPNNEFDEEFFEFGLFMSRREYKAIRRRMEAGRRASAKEGKYLGSKPPYGYMKVPLNGESGFTLEQIDDEAQTVKLIFEWYVNGKDGQQMGLTRIANTLNEYGIKPKYSDRWVIATVREILRNPVHCGKIHWDRRKTVKKKRDGEVVRSRPRSDPKDIIISKGKHEAIVSDELWNKAKEILDSKKHAPVKRSNELQNPYAGILICAKCGRKMVRKISKKANTIAACTLTGCDNACVSMEALEKKIHSDLKDWLDGYKVKNVKRKSVGPSALGTVRDKAIGELKKLKTQQANLCDLLERGLYDEVLFVERNRVISEKIEKAQEQISTIQGQLDIVNNRAEMEKNVVPIIEELVDKYDRLSPDKKNKMLKTVISKISYYRESSGRGLNKNPFNIEIYWKLSRV